MDVQLSPEKEAMPQDFATGAGRQAGQLVAEAVDRMLECDARFIEAVEVGPAVAGRGAPRNRLFEAGSALHGYA